MYFILQYNIMLLVSDTTDAVFRRTIHDVFSDME